MTYHVLMRERGDAVLSWLKRFTQGNYHERLSEYVDGRLDAEEAAKVEARLAEDHDARTEAAELRAVTDLLHRKPMVDAPRSFALPYAPSRVAGRQRGQGLRALSIATATAALALVLVTSVDIAGLVDNAPAGPATGATELAAAPEAAEGALTDTSSEESRLSAAPPAEGSEFAAAESQAPAIQQAAPAGDSDAGQENRAIDWLKLGLSALAAALALATLVLFWIPERPIT